MDSFTQSTADAVTAALTKAGHKPVQEDREGHSGFKITAAGTPGTIRLSYGLYINPLYSDLALIKRSRPARQLENLGRYTLDLLGSFHVHLCSTPKTRYLLVSQQTVQERDEMRAMMVRAALMDCQVYPGEEYHAVPVDTDPDTVRITFSPPEPDAKRSWTALEEARKLLTEQGWEVTSGHGRGFPWLHVWDRTFPDLESLS